MNKQDEKWLLDLKDQIEEAKEESNKLLGKEANLMESLKEEFGIDNLEDGYELVKKLEKEQQDLEEQIMADLKELEEELETMDND